MTQDAKTAARTSTADHIARFISQLKDGWSIGLKGPKGSHSHYGSQEFRDAVISALSALQDGEATEGSHPDDSAVDRFADAMKAKLAKKRSEGRGGWDGPGCSAQILSDLLRAHVDKGDPLDVGNLAMMLHQRGERII